MAETQFKDDGAAQSHGGVAGHAGARQGWMRKLLKFRQGKCWAPLLPYFIAICGSPRGSSRKLLCANHWTLKYFIAVGVQLLTIYLALVQVYSMIVIPPELVKLEELKRKSEADSTKQRDKDALNRKFHWLQTAIPAELSGEYEAIAQSAERTLMNTHSAGLHDLVVQARRVCGRVEESAEAGGLNAGTLETLLAAIRSVASEIDPVYPEEDVATLCRIAVALKDQIESKVREFMGQFPADIRDHDVQIFEEALNRTDDLILALRAATDGAEQRRLRVKIGTKLVTLRSLGMASAFATVEASKQLVDER